MAYSELPWRPFLGHQAWSWTTLRRGNVFYYVYKRFLSRFLILFERSFISMVSAVASWPARVKTEQFTSSLNPIGLKHCVLAEFRSFGMCAYAQPRWKVGRDLKWDGYWSLSHLPLLLRPCFTHSLPYSSFPSPLNTARFGENLLGCPRCPAKIGGPHDLQSWRGRVLRVP